MLLGKPAVATRVGGVPELIDDGVHGWLVPPGDPERFADRIVRLVRNPEEASRMGDVGRLKATRHFSVEAMVGNMEDVYTELLANGSRGNVSHQSRAREARQVGEEPLASSSRAVALTWNLEPETWNLEPAGVGGRESCPSAL
jgi:hypothetical protein